MSLKEPSLSVPDCARGVKSLDCSFEAMYKYTMLRIAFVLSLLAVPAVADVTSPSGKTVECYCTDSQGGRVELGESICLQVDGRAFMAQCDMSLNVPIWRDTGSGCLSSEVTPQEPSPRERLFQLL